jgi:hypothetical protein
MEAALKVPYSRYRINTLKRFLNKEKPSLDLGCGAYMPKILGTTHACDNDEIAYDYLKKQGWNGIFKVVNISNPLPFKDKEFRVVICSEVIEHLKSEKAVTSAIKEIDRISERWIVTTPSVYFSDRDHKFFFTPNELFRLMPWAFEDHTKKYIIFRKLNYYYITNDIERLGKILEIEWKKI